VSNRVDGGNGGEAQFMFADNGKGVGGGIFSRVDAAVGIRNSLIFANTALDGEPDIADEGSTISYHGTNIAGFPTGMNLAIGPLESNGGPTWTHALLPGNAAIDASVEPTSVQKDQRGAPRPSGGGIDLGAFETPPAGPTILDIPGDVSALIGETARLSVRATGEIGMGYRWERLNNGFWQLAGMESTLLFTNLSLTDFGSYRVVIANSIHSVTSGIVRLHQPTLGSVLNAEGFNWHSLGWTPTSADTHDGFDAATTAPRSDGSSLPLSTSATGPLIASFWWKATCGESRFQFRVNSETRIEQKCWSGWDRKQLIIPDDQALLEWRYVVDSYDSPPAQAWLDQVRITPITVPVFVRQPEDLIALAGDDTSLQVAAVAPGPIAYQWYHGETPILSSTRDPVLHLGPLTTSASGNYQVVVSNMHGSVTSRIATVSARYSLTVETNGPGRISRTPDAGNYLPDSIVTVTAHPLTNAYFLRWEGDVQSPNPIIDLRMDRHKILKAVFVNALDSKLPLVVDHLQLGRIRVDLTNRIGYAGWRFPWDLEWRAPGSVASGLPEGVYPVEIARFADSQAPKRIQIALSVGQSTNITTGYPSLGSGQPGSLKVRILPEDVAASPDLECRGQWHLEGEAEWRDDANVAEGLPPGRYRVEFKTLPSRCYREPPRPAFVDVHSNSPAELDGPSYGELAQSPNRQKDLTFQAIQARAEGQPYAFNGQISDASGVHHGSGIVVAEHVVLTAAHMVFDAQNLTWRSGASWHFQRHGQDFNPPPIHARGYFVFSDYAAQLTNGLAGTGLPLSSWDLDVAALFFYGAAGRGGYSGYLVSSVNTNRWLEGTASRRLIGYPDQAISTASRGRMHELEAFPGDLVWITNSLYRSATLRGLGGNSGSGVYVPYLDSRYYPAGIYLGNSTDGGVIRAIDERAASLIELATSASKEGTNTTSGGVIRIAPYPRLYSVSGGELASLCSGYVTVSLGPPAAMEAGAAWRISPRYSAFSKWTNWTQDSSQRLPLQNGAFEIEWREIPGFDAPSTPEMDLECGTQTNLVMRYVQRLPRFEVLERGLVRLKTHPGSRIEIESSPTLSGQMDWLPWTNVVIPSEIDEFVVPLAKPTPEFPERYFRARLLRP